jgi:AraC-like DNA-binding protein/mannose-6-phosphate isomerase-like protein (cupin superfamily)
MPIASSIVAAIDPNAGSPTEAQDELSLSGGKLWCERVYWQPHRSILITPDGKHSPKFDERFPILLQFVNFSVNYHLTPSYHDYLELVYIYKGEGTFVCDDREYKVHGGDILVIGNTEFHVLEASQKHPLQVVNLYFLMELIYTAGGNTLDFEYLKPFFDHSVELAHVIPGQSEVSGQIFRLLKGIATELRVKGPLYQLSTKTYLCEILLILARYFQRYSGDSKIFSQKSFNIKRLKSVFTHLQANYQKKLTLQQVAEVACMSPSYFCNFFKKVTGCTLVEYLTRLRIDKSKVLLLQGELPVTQIGYEVGFENHSYFDKVFKTLQGMSPLEFRRKTLEKGDGSG